MSRPGKRPFRISCIPARYRLKVVPVPVPVRRAHRHQRLINRGRRGTLDIASTAAKLTAPALAFGNADARCAAQTGNPLLIQCSCVTCCAE
jgi:hypothetical protein